MVDLLQTAFERLTTSLAPKASVAPYPYQLAVAESLLAGRRVVLRAPVGSGKGMAMLLPWLASRVQPCDFPPTLLHVLPGGTFFADVQRRLERATHDLAGARVGVQTEGDAFDPFFLSDAIITSADQLLSVALHRPLGLHPSLKNTNAGVLLGSYACFDEFPALATRESLVTWIGLLRRHYPITRCLWTTAVWPRVVAEHVATLLDAEYIDMSTLESGGRRTWSTLPGISADGIMRLHRERTIVVCNSVRGAQTLYRALRRHLDQQGAATRLMLLHQYQFSRDRLPIEAEAAGYFTPAGATDALLITTSGLNIGGDLSAELLISDPVSPDRLLLRAGHCARFAGEEGRLLVTQVSAIAKEPAYQAPPATRLTNLLADGAAHSAAEELAAVDALWETALPEEQPELLRTLPTAEECDDYAARVIADGAGQHLFSRVGVALHRVPETVQDPFELERFSLALTSLRRGWHQWEASGRAEEWFALVPQWSAYGQQAPSWSLLTHPQEITAEAQILVLNAEAVSYDPVLGLELSPGTPYQSERLPMQHTTWSPFDQHVETFTEHAMRTLAVYDQLAGWYRYVLRHLGQHWHIPVVDLEQWMRVCILWHDAGKLTSDWQRSAYRWQQEAVRRPTPQAVLARIDYQYRRDGQYPCPAHAENTGKVLARALAVLLDNRQALHQGTLAALSHHHGMTPVPESDQTPHPEAWDTLMSLAEPVLDARMLHRVDHAGWTLHTARAQQAIEATMPREPEALMAYSLLVRAIRLADREVALAALLS